MTTLLTSQDWVELAKPHPMELCCTMYLPLEPAGVDLRTKRAQLKSATDMLKTSLAEKHWPVEKADALCASLGELVRDHHFLNPNSKGLAILLTAAQPEAMKVLSLNFSPPLSAAVGETYVITPLLRQFGSGTAYSVLTVAEGGTRLLRGSAESLEEVPLPESFPSDRFDTDSKPETKEGPKHQGFVDIEVTKQYYRQIGHALRPLLADHEQILLAGVHEQLALFRRLNPDLRLLSEEMHGNFESEPLESLRSKALNCLARVGQAAQEKEILAIKELEPNLRSHQWEEIEEAARVGRVQTLYLPREALDEPRLEGLALEVLKSAGAVVMLAGEQPRSALLARFRWAAIPIGQP